MQQPPSSSLQPPASVETMESAPSQQPPPPLTGNIPYLGSKISLISKAKIRYEGILYTIDAQESTVALAKVRSYGTENRLAEHYVPARDEVYEYIIFRAADIEDLHVSEPPRATCLHETIRARRQQDNIDPAIVQHAPLAPAARIQNYAAAASGMMRHRRCSYDEGGFINDCDTFRPPGVPPLSYLSRPPQQQHFVRRFSSRGSPFGRGRFRGGRRGGGGGGGSGLKFDGDFDFEKSNEEYNRLADAMQNQHLNSSTYDDVVVEPEQQEAAAAKNDESNTSTNSDRFYDKGKSFFDTISCEALEREKGNDSKIRKSWQEEKQQNAETFGTVYPTQHPRFHQHNNNNNNQFYQQGPPQMMHNNRFPARNPRGRIMYGTRFRRFHDEPPMNAQFAGRFNRYHNNNNNHNEHQQMQQPPQNWNNGYYNNNNGGGGGYRNVRYDRQGQPLYRRHSPAMYA